jgi:hypothetical protein
MAPSALTAAELAELRPHAALRVVRDENALTERFCIVDDEGNVAFTASGLEGAEDVAKLLAAAPRLLATVEAMQQEIAALHDAVALAQQGRAA